MKKIFLPLILLSSCSSNYPPITKEVIVYDYPIERTISWENCLSIEEEYYLLYFYSPTCGHCIDLKPDFLEYYYSCNPPLYFVNCLEGATYKANKENIIGISSEIDLYILGTPSLMEIKDNIVYKYYGGTKEIRLFIDNNSICFN